MNDLCPDLAKCEDIYYNDLYHRYPGFCVDANPGYAPYAINNNTVCYVGHDPCYLMNSGADVCPKSCIEKCCPGNKGPPMKSNKPAHHQTPAAQHHQTPAAQHHQTPAAQHHQTPAAQHHPGLPRKQSDLYLLCNEVVKSENSSYKYDLKRPVVKKIDSSVKDILSKYGHNVSNEIFIKVPFLYSYNYDALVKIASLYSNEGFYDLQSEFINCFQDLLEKKLNKQPHYRCLDKEKYTYLDSLGPRFWDYAITVARETNDIHMTALIFFEYFYARC